MYSVPLFRDDDEDDIDISDLNREDLDDTEVDQQVLKSLDALVCGAYLLARVLLPLKYESLCMRVLHRAD